MSAARAPAAPQELRVVIRAHNYDATVRLLRDGLGLNVTEHWNDPEGRGIVLDARHATIEIVDAPQAERFDAIEAPGHRSSPLRLAFRVQGTPAAAQQLETHGARALAPDVHTPWGHHTRRLVTPEGLHLTLYTPEVNP